MSILNDCEVIFIRHYIYYGQMKHTSDMPWRTYIFISPRYLSLSHVIKLLSIFISRTTCVVQLDISFSYIINFISWDGVGLGMQKV